MTSSNMLNFRVKDVEKASIDEAVRRSGLTRTDFIKTWVMRGVSEMGISPAAPVNPRASRPSKSVAKCRHPKDARQKLATGVNLCTICKVRFR